MRAIAESTEASELYAQAQARLPRPDVADAADATIEAASAAADGLEGRAVVAFTASARTCFKISFFRPRTNIIGATFTERAYNRLGLCFGVQALLLPRADNIDGLYFLAEKNLLERRMVEPGQWSVLVTGSKHRRRRGHEHHQDPPRWGGRSHRRSPNRCPLRAPLSASGDELSPDRRRLRLPRRCLGAGPRYTPASPCPASGGRHAARSAGRSTSLREARNDENPRIQAKHLLKGYGLAVPEGVLCTSPEEAGAAFDKLGKPISVVKAQIHAGGRGKGGGVRLVKSAEEATEAARDIMAKNLITHQTGPEGQPVRRIWVEEGSDIQDEYYIGIAVDRGEAAPVMMASSEGGMEIETVAEETPEKILKETINPATGLRGYQARRLAKGIGIPAPLINQATRFLQGLAKAFSTMIARSPRSTRWSPPATAR